MRHIVHLIDSFNLGGGAQRFLSQFISNVKNSSSDRHTVIALHSPDAEYKTFKKFHSDVHRMSSCKANPMILFKLIKKINSLRPDILHLHLEVSTYTAPLLKIISPKSKIITSIYMTREAAPFWAYHVFAMIQRAVDLYICCTDELTDIGIPENKVYKKLKVPIDIQNVDIIPRETNLIFSKHHLSVDDIILLSVGRLHRDKQHHLAINAMPDLINRFEKIRLIILGEGSERNRLERMIRHLGLENNVVLAGFQEEVEGYYAAASVYLRPSRKEGTNLSVLKAMACKLPIVANINNSPCECIHDRIEGRIINFESKMDVVQVVSEFILDREISLKYGSNAALCLEEYSLNKYIDGVSQIYAKYAN